MGLCRHNRLGIVAVIALFLLFGSFPPFPSAAQDKVSGVDPYAEVPDSYIREAVEYTEYCKNNSLMRSYYDCECLGTKFLDTRIKEGIVPTKESIAFGLSKECRDATEAAGTAYNDCMQTTGTMSSGTDPEKFCECVGNSYSKLIDHYKPPIDSRTMVHFATQSRIYCTDPQKARRFNIVIPK